MLLLFSFSITPRTFLHICTGNHKIATHKLPVADHPQVEQLSPGCDCDNFVTGSPFTETVKTFELPAVAFFYTTQEPKPVHFFSSLHFSFSLRGPPVV